VLSDPRLARQMGRRGRAVADRALSLERKRAAYRELYCSVLDNRRPILAAPG